MFSAAFGGWSAGFLYDGRAQGVALLGVALGYAATSVVLFRRDRDVASVLWAIALTLAAVGAASLTSGPTLTIVWAAEAAILAWLARRIAEPRFQLASLAWLGLAFAHGLAFDAPFARLFEENSDAWRAAPSAAALAVATVLVGLCTFTWTPSEEGLFSQLFSDLLDAQPWLRRGAFALAGVTAVYAGSLAIVSLPASWDRGHVLVAALWSAVAVSLIVVGRRSRASRPSLRRSRSCSPTTSRSSPRSNARGHSRSSRSRRSSLLSDWSFARVSSSSGRPSWLRRRARCSRLRLCWSSTTTSTRAQRCSRSQSATRRLASRCSVAGATSRACSACSPSCWPYPHRSSC